MKEKNNYLITAKRWYLQAREDFKSANILLEHERHYLVYFLSQQIVEKALKALLYYHGENIVYGHSVKKLADWVGKLENNLQNLSKKVAILDVYYITTRYPYALPGSIPAEVFTKKDSVETLKIASEIIQLVEKCLKIKNNEEN